MSEFTKEDGMELVRIGREMIAHAKRDDEEAAKGAGPEVLIDQFNRMADYVAQWLPLYLKFVKASKPEDATANPEQSKAWFQSIMKIGPHIEALGTLAVQIQYYSDVTQEPS